MSGPSVEIEGRKVGESDAAICVHIEDTAENVWFPFSQVISMHFDGRGVGHIIVTKWIAEQKGLA